MIEYKDDKQLEGVQTFENGDVYQGAFKDGKKHGKGILRTRNDRSYEGEWKYDKPHGFGINTFPNGKIYTGNFEMVNLLVKVNGHMLMEEFTTELGLKGHL